MTESPLIIWVNSPPHVESGAFSYIEDNWPSTVAYAVLGQLRAERAAMGWGTDGSNRKAEVYTRGNSIVTSFADALLHRFPDAMHLVAGMSSVTGHALSRIVRRVPRNRIAVFSERPCAYGPLPRRLPMRLMQPVKYRRIVAHYRERVGLLLPLGLAGMEQFRAYGWPSERMTPFMYCPQRRAFGTPEVDGQFDRVRFLYVGRLTRYTKGTDILMRAVEQLHGDWRLTIVGGHGDLVETVQNWAMTKPQVNLLGATPPSRVWEVMKHHHVIVVPSRVDGWNVVVNESLYANRGVIASKSAVSDELVNVSGAGRVVPPRSARALATAMQSVVDEPDLVAAWAKAAHRYCDFIAPESVGNYLIHLFQWLASEDGSAIPAAPWLQPNLEHAPGEAK